MMFLVESAEAAAQRNAAIYGWMTVPPMGTPGRAADHHQRLGDCGAADGVLALALAMLQRQASAIVAAADAGHPPMPIEISVDDACACYTPAGSRGNA